MTSMELHTVDDAFLSHLECSRSCTVPHGRSRIVDKMEYSYPQPSVRRIPGELSTRRELSRSTWLTGPASQELIGHQMLTMS